MHVPHVPSPGSALHRWRRRGTSARPSRAAWTSRRATRWSGSSGATQGGDGCRVGLYNPQPLPRAPRLGPHTPTHTPPQFIKSSLYAGMAPPRSSSPRTSSPAALMSPRCALSAFGWGNAGGWTPAAIWAAQRDAPGLDCPAWQPTCLPPDCWHVPVCNPERARAQARAASRTPGACSCPFPTSSSHTRTRSSYTAPLALPTAHPSPLPGHPGHQL